MEETEFGIIKVGDKVKHQVNYELLSLYKDCYPNKTPRVIKKSIIKKKI